MDDPDCDSTWEDAEEEEEEEEEEEDGDGPSSAGDDDGEAGAPGDAGDAEDEDEEARPGLLQSRMTVSRNWRAMRDTCRYRHHYPDLTERDGNGDMPNLSFYRNEIRFLPNGCFIEDILQNWREDYDLLEDNHSYIQWLFPLRELGVNWHAKPLTQREIEAFKSCKEASARFVQAYELMLGFYGIELEDRDTGRVRRAQNYRKRFQNLNWHSHNNLRITRILKSLGELGLERYQAPLVRFFLEETLVRRELLGVRQSALDYFVFTVRCRRQRRALLRFAWEHFRPRSKFVWGPPGRLRRLRLRSPPRAPAQAGPRQAEGKESPGDPLPEGGDCVTAEPQLLSDEPQEKGTREKEAQERDRGEEVGSQGEEGPESSSPQESKKRKLEVNLREQAQGEPGSQSASEVEKIALNLEGCALSQGSLGAGTQEMGSQDPGETEQPCAPSPEAREADDEVRKRRKVDQMPAPSEGPEAGVRENGKQEGQAGGQGSPEQGAPRSAAPAEPAPEEKAEPAEAVLEAKPQTP